MGLKFKKLKNNEILFSLLIIIFISGCKNKSTIYFYSLDKSQCITIISEYDYRYIIDGKHDQPPDTNYVKVHLKDRNSMWDGFHVCWNNEKYEWDAVVKNSEILESKLDTTKFNFSTKLPIDERSIPTEIKFRKENCAIYSFYSKKLSPDQGAIVIYK
ncbi:MAG: hypothetical protein WAR79_00260 [Melioribacteraceae bacterium]